MRYSIDPDVVHDVARQVVGLPIGSDELTTRGAKAEPTTDQADGPRL